MPAPLEIERKFLVPSNIRHVLALAPGKHIRQGYLTISGPSKSGILAIEGPAGRIAPDRPLLDGIIQDLAEETTLRIRFVDDEKAFLTVKIPTKPGGEKRSIERIELETGVSLDFAIGLWDLVGDRHIEKIRHEFEQNGRRWDIDVYLSPFEGLATAEVEFVEGEDTNIPLPSWLGPEISEDPAMSNEKLANLRARRGPDAGAIIRQKVRILTG